MCDAALPKVELHQAKVDAINPSELKFLELLKSDEESGVIRFKHRRMLIFDADAMGLLRKELIETFARMTARRLTAA